MKKTILTLISLIWVCFAYAQPPQKFNYQGVAKDPTGAVIKGQKISIRTSILDGSMNGTSQYSETHSVTTDRQTGSFKLIIGNGSVVSGKFATITWDIGTKFLKIEIDVKGSGNYSTLETPQTIGVPYALFSGAAIPVVNNIAMFEERYPSGTSAPYLQNRGQNIFTRQLNKTVLGSSYVKLLAGGTSNACIEFLPGTYLIEAHASCYTCDDNKLFLADNLTSAVRLSGSNGFSNGTSDVVRNQSTSFLNGVIVVPKEDNKWTLRFDQKISTVPVNNIFGKENNFQGLDEVYSQIKIERIGD